MSMKQREGKGCPGLSRRKFIKSVSGAAGAALILNHCSPQDTGTDTENQPETVLGPRIPVPNSYVNSAGKPLLVCVEGSNFSEMLIAGMNAIGGFGKLIGNREVLIKPNLNHEDPFPGITDPESIIAIIREIQKVSTSQVFVGDMGHYTTVYNYLNLRQRMSDVGATLLDFSDSYPVRRDTWEQSKPNFRVYQDVYDAQVIINTCCIKRHLWAYLTCSIKCTFGCVTGPHAGGTRDYVHYRGGNFMPDLAEVAGLVNPELNIVDARSILVDDGPMIEQGRVLDGVNKIVISGDIVATDVYCAKIMADNDPTFSYDLIRRTIDRAEELGLGTSDLNEVDIIEITV